MSRVARCAIPLDAVNVEGHCSVVALSMAFGLCGARPSFAVRMPDGAARQREPPRRLCQPHHGCHTAAKVPRLSARTLRACPPVPRDRVPLGAKEPAITRVLNRRTHMKPNARTIASRQRKPQVASLPQPGDGTATVTTPSELVTLPISVYQPPHDLRTRGAGGTRRERSRPRCASADSGATHR